MLQSSYVKDNSLSYVIHWSQILCITYQIQILSLNRFCSSVRTGQMDFFFERSVVCEGYGKRIIIESRIKSVYHLSAPSR